MSQKSHIPIIFVTAAGQLGLDAVPKPVDQVPLDVDVVLEDQRDLVAILEHAFDGARLTPIGRDDPLVNLSHGEGFERVPQQGGDVQRGRRGRG